MKEQEQEYRLLGIGEIIRQGDEFFAPCSKLWTRLPQSSRVGMQVATFDYKYRRKITQEKEQKMKPYYQVYRVGSLPPQVKHETIHAAKSEAVRLAQKHPGESFEILKCVAIVSAPAPTASTFWMEIP